MSAWYPHAMPSSPLLAIAAHTLMPFSLPSMFQPFVHTTYLYVLKPHIHPDSEYAIISHTFIHFLVLYKAHSTTEHFTLPCNKPVLSCCVLDQCCNSSNQLFHSYFIYTECCTFNYKDHLDPG